MKRHKNCQSCGMPLKKDRTGKATNADGTKNRMYCGHCFSEGSFNQPDITIEEMQAFVANKLKEMRFPGFLARRYVKGLIKLERWKTN